MVQLVSEFSEDAAGCRGRGLILDDCFIDGLNVGGIVGGEDGDVGGEFGKASQKRSDHHKGFGRK